MHEKYKAFQLIEKLDIEIKYHVGLHNEYIPLIDQNLNYVDRI